MKKTNILLVGCNQSQGLTLRSFLEQSNFICSFGFDDTVSDFPSFSSSEELSEFGKTLFADKELIISVGSPKTTMKVLPFAVKYQIPMVLATTGFAKGQEAFIKAAADKIPIFKDNNMCYGIAVINRLLQEAAKYLGYYSVSITENSEKTNPDTPDETAQMLANTLNNANTGFEQCSVSSVPEQSLTRKYEINFLGKTGDCVRIKHIAYGSTVAEGTLLAAHYILGKAPGIYTMDNLLG